jgi:hypothetical protein
MHDTSLTQAVGKTSAFRVLAPRQLSVVKVSRGCGIASLLTDSIPGIEPCFCDDASFGSLLTLSQVCLIPSLLLGFRIASGSHLCFPFLPSCLDVFGSPAFLLFWAIRCIVPFLFPHVPSFPTSRVVASRFDLFDRKTVFRYHAIGKVVDETESGTVPIRKSLVSSALFSYESLEDFFVGVQFDFTVLLAFKTIDYLDSMLDVEIDEWLRKVLPDKTTNRRHQTYGANSRPAASNPWPVG